MDPEIISEIDCMAEFSASSIVVDMPDSILLTVSMNDVIEAPNVCPMLDIASRIVDVKAESRLVIVSTIPEIVPNID